jgi:hypothetical protein
MSGYDIAWQPATSVLLREGLPVAVLVEPCQAAIGSNPQGAVWIKR